METENAHGSVQNANHNSQTFGSSKSPKKGSSGELFASTSNNISMNNATARDNNHRTASPQRPLKTSTGLNHKAKLFVSAEPRMDSSFDSRRSQEHFSGKASQTLESAKPQTAPQPIPTPRASTGSSTSKQRQVNRH